MEIIAEYEKVSDQQLNKDKSFFMVTDNTNQQIIDTIIQETGSRKKHCPIMYLGSPLYIGGQRIIYYSDLVEKVIKKIAGWQAKILNFWGKTTLVKHVLQSMPIHTLAAVSPPKTTLNYIKRVIADFFWGSDKDKKSYHWESLESLC